MSSSLNPLPDDVAQIVMENVPSFVREGFEQFAAHNNMTIAQTVEMAIACFLDEEAWGFGDCLLKERMKTLEDRNLESEHL